MSLSRRWLALVLALFCLPLFVGLGRADIENDEAISSFVVDRIVQRLWGADTIRDAVMILEDVPTADLVKLLRA